MATLRPLKEGSVRTYQEKVALGFPDILASEMDADLDTIYAAWNTTAGGDLQGNYPNPTIRPSALPWTPSGATLTPTDATKIVAIPGGTGSDQTAVQFGTRTQKGRLVALPSYDWVGLTRNRRFTGSVWARDDTAQPSWTLAFADTDQFLVARENAAGVAASLLTLDSAGKLSLPLDGDPVVTLGSGSVKGGISADVSGNVTFFSNHPWLGATAQAGWSLHVQEGSDQLAVWRKPAGNAAGVGVVNVFKIDGAANLTITGATGTKASGTTWANPSDRRLKDDITEYPTGLAAILALTPRTFLYNGKGGSQAGLRGFGYIADEVAPVIPEMLGVTKAKLNADDEEDTDIQTLDTSNITLALVNAVKELAARVVALETRPGLSA